MILVDASRVWRSGRISYQGLSFSALCDEALLQHNMCLENFKNPWGGQYQVYPTGSNALHFAMVIDSVQSPSALKNALLKSSLNQDHVEVNGKIVTATYD